MREVNLAKGHTFTQVRPLSKEVKTYVLLSSLLLDVGLDYKDPTPLEQESATSLWYSRVSLSDSAY